MVAGKTLDLTDHQFHGAPNVTISWQGEVEKEQDPWMA